VRLAVSYPFFPFLSPKSGSPTQEALFEMGKRARENLFHLTPTRGERGRVGERGPAAAAEGQNEGDDDEPGFHLRLHWVTCPQSFGFFSLSLSASLSH